MHLQWQKLLSRGALQMVCFNINVLFLECQKEKWGWIVNARDLCELDSDYSHSLLSRNFWVFWCTLLSKGCLWSIHHPLHMQSTPRVAHNKPDWKKGMAWKGRKRIEKKKRGRPGNFYIIDRSEAIFLFRSFKPLFLPAVCMSKTAGEGRNRWGRTFEKPFHTWSGDMDPMRQRRGTQYFKVTQQHGTCSHPHRHAFAALPGGIPLARVKPPCLHPSLPLWIITASHAEAPRLTKSGERAFIFFLNWTVCVHPELQMNCEG